MRKESLKVMGELCKEYKQDRVLIEIEGDEKTANFLKENGFVIEENQEGVIIASKKI